MQVSEALKSDQLQHGSVQKKSYSPSKVSKRGQYTLLNKEDVVSTVTLSHIAHYQTIRKTKLNYQSIFKQEKHDSNTAYGSVSNGNIIGFFLPLSGRYCLPL